MLRQAGRALLSAARLGQARSVSTSFAILDVPDDAQKKSRDEFLALFKNTAPSTLNPPFFASDYVTADPRATPGAPVPEKLTFSFHVPHGSIFKGDKVSLPTSRSIL